MKKEPSAAYTDLFGEVRPDAPKELPKGVPKGYARPPGTGPAGETCGSCKKCVSVQGGSKRYNKCLIIRHRWTSGPGTDIKRKSPACEMWEGHPI